MLSFLKGLLLGFVICTLIAIIQKRSVSRSSGSRPRRSSETSRSRSPSAQKPDDSDTDGSIKFANMQQLSDDDYDMDSAIARVYATEQTSEQRTAAGNNPPLAAVDGTESLPPTYTTRADEILFVSGDVPTIVAQRSSLDLLANALAPQYAIPDAQLREFLAVEDFLARHASVLWYTVITGRECGVFSDPVRVYNSVLGVDGAEWLRCPSASVARAIFRYELSRGGCRLLAEGSDRDTLVDIDGGWNIYHEDDGSLTTCHAILI